MIGRGIVASTALIVLLLAAVPGKADEGSPAVVLVDGAGAARLDDVHRRLEAAGARLPHVLPPDVLVGRLPDGAVDGPTLPDGVALRVLRPDEPWALPRGEARPAVRAALRLLTGATRAPDGLPPGAAPSDVVAPTELEEAAWVRPKALGDPDCDRPSATSACLAGRVAVAIVLPESAGPSEDTEDWANDDPSYPGTPRPDLVLAEIMEGLDELVTALPEAGLTFVHDSRPGVESGLEPILHPVGDRGGWISEILEAVGYGARAESSGVRGDLADLREAHDADWALAAFVADDLNDADNGFPPTGFPFAHAQLGGPDLVMTYDNDGWGIGRMNVAFRHELGHCHERP